MGEVEEKEEGAPDQAVQRGQAEDQSRPPSARVSSKKITHIMNHL